MFTHKSLIVSLALLLAFACTGVLATSAHTTQPVQARQSVLPFPNGISAITKAHDNQNLLSFLDVRHYLNTRGFIGGPTLNGQPPYLQSLQLTNILHLDSLLSLLLPQMPGAEQVYYARLDGPLIVLPDLPLPVLSTLLPSLSNLPAFIPHLANLSSTGLLNVLPFPARMPDLSHWQNNSPAPVLSHAQANVHSQPNKQALVLANAYEVFDAHNGNLLAWG